MSLPSRLSLMIAAFGLLIAVSSLAVEASPAASDADVTSADLGTVAAESQEVEVDVDENGNRMAKEYDFAKQLIIPNMSGPRKDFFVSKYIQTTWFRAIGYCNMYNMTLATFATPVQYNDLISGIRSADINGDFWIGVTKLGDGKKYIFFPTYKPISDIVGLPIPTGNGECVYLKIDKNHSVLPKLVATECSSITDQKSFICDFNPDGNPLFYRL